MSIGHTTKEVSGKIIFQSREFVVLGNLFVLWHPKDSWRHGRWDEKTASNCRDIIDAEAAARRWPEAGVKIPMPEYEVPEGWPIATLEEIEKAISSIRFNPEKDLGPEIDRWQSEHTAECSCGDCPEVPVYSGRRFAGPGWEIDCPEAWFHGNDQIRNVYLPDGRKCWSADLRPEVYDLVGEFYRIEKYNLPPELDSRVRVAYEEKKKLRAEEEARHRAEYEARLKEKFGITVEGR